MLLDSILAISSIFFVSIFFICYKKLKTKKEAFDNVLHIEGSHNPEQVIFANKNDVIDKDKYFGAFDYSGNLTIDEYSSIYVGPAKHMFSKIDYTFVDNLTKVNFPYIEKGGEGESDKIRFNNKSGYIDANDLRVLQGKKLAPFYFYGNGNKVFEKGSDYSRIPEYLAVNNHALKIEADTGNFENYGMKCGYMALPKQLLDTRGKVIGSLDSMTHHKFPSKY